MVRIYSFPELMGRLMSHTWEVVQMKQGFVFVPEMYRDHGKRFPRGKKS